jgi:transcriptional regulator with XRE-family HTH domain
MTQQQPSQPAPEAQWAARLAQVVAQQVQRLRAAQRISAQKLAEATADLGHPVPRSVIANLESGRREAVSIAEVLVLARALGVPPLELIFPLGQEGGRTIEVLPNTVVGTWTAAQWFTGERPFAVDTGGEWSTDEGDLDRWHDSAVRLFRLHQDYIDQWDDARRRVDRARAQAAAAGDEGVRAAAAAEEGVYRSVMDAWERGLHGHRRDMRRLGLDPGKLPAHLAHVDADGERS